MKNVIANILKNRKAPKNGTNMNFRIADARDIKMSEDYYNRKNSARPGWSARRPEEMIEQELSDEKRRTK